MAHHGILNIFAFLASLGFVFLYFAVGEPIIIGFLQGWSFAAEGTTPRLIILGGPPLLMLLGGIYFLTRNPEQVRWSA